MVQTIDLKTKRKLDTVSVFDLMNNKYELRNKSFKTFGSPKYALTKTTTEQPYFYLGVAEHPYVKVMYQDDDSFRFVFDNGSEQLGVKSNDVENELLSLSL